MDFTFIETTTFTAGWRRNGLGDEELDSLQQTLAENPDAGVVERGTGGLRKIRFAPSGMGKSGGFRVCYYVVRQRGEIDLLVVYGKNRKASLTAAEKSAVAKLIAEIDRSADW